MPIFIGNSAGYDRWEVYLADYADEAIDVFL